MTADPLTINPDETVFKAVQMMNQVWIRHLPVCDGDKVVGMLSDRDLRNFELQEWINAVDADKVREYLAMPVSKVMSEDVVTVGPDTSSAESAAAMLDAKISALPVVDDGKLIGMVTTDDLLRTLKG